MTMLSEKEIDYIFKSERGLSNPNRGEFYYDNPSAAIEDIEYLIDIIKRLTDKDGDDWNDD
jgi:hypothetical protein